MLVWSLLLMGGATFAIGLLQTHFFMSCFSVGGQPAHVASSLAP